TRRIVNSPSSGGASAADSSLATTETMAWARATEGVPRSRGTRPAASTAHGVGAPVLAAPGRGAECFMFVFSKPSHTGPDAPQGRSGMCLPTVDTEPFLHAGVRSSIGGPVRPRD